jgi:predicted nucleotidyltransferase
METVEVKDIFIYTGEGEYFSLRPYTGAPINSLKAYLRYVSDGVDLYGIYPGMRTMVSDGADLYFMSETTREISGNDFVCQAVIEGVRGVDKVCQIRIPLIER